MRVANPLRKYPIHTKLVPNIPTARHPNFSTKNPLTAPNKEKDRNQEYVPCVVKQRLLLEVHLDHYTPNMLFFM